MQHIGCAHQRAAHQHAPSPKFYLWFDALLWGLKAYYEVTNGEDDPASRVVPTACSGGRLFQARGEACQCSSCNTGGTLMADVDDLLQKAGVDDGRAAAKLQRDVDSANDDVRTLETRYNAAF